MPIQLRTPGKGGSTKATLPAYFFRSREEQATRLLDFVRDVERASYDYYTEDLEFGRALLNEHKDKASLVRLRQNASPYMDEVLTLAMAAMTIEELEKTLWECTYPVPTSTNSRNENSIMIVPVGEPEQTLRGFVGKVNKKPTDDLYGTLSAGLDEDVIEDMRHQIKSFWDGDTLTLRYGQYAWEGVVDEAMLAEKLEKSLGKEALKDLAVANFLTDSGREAVARLAAECSPMEAGKYLTGWFGKTVSVKRTEGSIEVDGVKL